jgi:hypothetical protein
MRRPILILALIATFTAAGCGASTATSTARTQPAPGSAAGPTALASTVAGSNAPHSTASGSSAAATATPAPTDTVWLCKPGLADNPCEGNLEATPFDSTGKAGFENAEVAADPPIDCFYVYPTVSRQTTANANLTIDPEERNVAGTQAERFSQVCRVYAPMYPQLTLAAIANPSRISVTAALTAYGGVFSAFEDYLAHYNHGRGIVFIGHSQGAMMLTALLRNEIDPRPDLRRLLVSAILLGGNVTVPVGRSVGGDFAGIAACSSASQVGCVVAYSSFGQTPPADAYFSRIDTAILPFGRGSTGPLEIMCVNPAAPGGGTASLKPYFPTGSLVTYLGKAGPSFDTFTPWVAFPDQYAAQCKDIGGASWLQIDHVAGATDLRTAVSAAEGPAWGLHVLDVNIALGNLVDLIRSEAAAFK